MANNVPGGKGSAVRPSSVDEKTFNNNWEAIFGKNKKNEESQQSMGCGNCKECSRHDSDI